MMRRTLAANALLRLLLIVVFLPHAIGKIQYHGTFESKFDLSTGVTIATAVAEMLAVAGALGTLVLLVVYAPRFARLTWVVTALTTVAIWIVQVGAIAVARWPNWIEFNSGMEYNVTLLVLVSVMLLLTPWPSRRPARS